VSPDPANPLIPTFTAIPCLLPEFVCCRRAVIRGSPPRGERQESSSSLNTWSVVCAWMIALRFSLFLMMRVSFARMRR